ncbi:nuclear pore complex protein NUP50A-like [Prosopis cineraria]|uniref:nuclear pore complex protein NUP50A-like n=1 Tax=Prosopis cineraria TaxID=364024 RepID=UPI00240F04E9|nr:nuclear pore complex protein NUP50A-like [Prosopis cineraria]XP_054785050.1 nuclear pore complex protein NUP50A-like [Prosopis cineraria]
MGDADNALPPSKKRAAGRELSRDTPIDDEEDSTETESGTFKRASDEVLATRRIVKVRRQQTNAAPSTNPFAGIRLVSPESSATPTEATPKAQATSENTVADDTKCTDGVTCDSEKAKDGDIKQLESKVDESGKKSTEIKDAAEENVVNREDTAEESTGEKSEVDKQQREDHDKNDNEDKKDADDKETATEADVEQTSKNDGDKKGAEAKLSAGEVDKEQTDKNSNEDKKDAEDKENPGEVEKEQTKVGDDTVNDDQKGKKDAEDKENTGEVEKEQTKVGDDTVNDDQKGNTDNVAKEDNTVERQETSSEGTSLKSFQQLSSSQNAFSGLAGTGFSASSFSFGSLSSEGSALGSGSGSIFGIKNDKPFGLGLSNNGTSVFGATGASAAAKAEGSGFPPMQEVVVETGEENEKVVFNADSILFEFVDGSWKERGKGELKVNISSGGNEKARLLMRTRGNYRLILNARLYPDIKLTNMEKKGVTFACVNSANEGKDGLSTFALRFKDGSIVEEFKATVMAHKGEKATVLKTPENSPKASDG